MHYRARQIAQEARFNNCTCINLFRDCNMKGQTQWEIFIGTDQFGGFRELVVPTKWVALKIAMDIAAASNGFIREIYAQRGNPSDMRKASLT